MQWKLFGRLLLTKVVFEKKRLGGELLRTLIHIFLNKLLPENNSVFLFQKVIYKKKYILIKIITSSNCLNIATLRI